MNRLLIILFMAICGPLSYSQSSVISEQTYDVGALYGYMNGGSELFKEYNFVKLIVKELNINGQNIKIECFEMDSPESAFGIYSVNVYKCQPCNDLPITDFCFNDYQVQAVVGPCYLSIINTTGSAIAQESSRQVLDEYLANNNNDEHFKLPEYIIKLAADNVMYFNGSLAIENRANSWFDIFNELQIESCYLLKWGKTKTSMMVFEETEKQDYSAIIKDVGLSFKTKKGFIYILKHDASGNLDKELLDSI